MPATNRRAHRERRAKALHGDKIRRGDWRPFPGFEKTHLINPQGRVKRRGRRRKDHPMVVVKDGVVVLWTGGRPTWRRVNKVVYEVFGVELDCKPTYDPRP